MCTYYYLHYHHIAPCARDIDYSLQYDFCENSTIVRSVPSPSSTARNANIGSNQNRAAAPFSPSSTTTTSAPSTTAHRPRTPVIDYIQQPCASLTHASEYNTPAEMIDYSNPCATGGCLLSSGCTSGQCRLEDLGGRWVCCCCLRGGNAFRWCAHPMKKVPDTMCYHTVCEGCWADG
ncbi:hypothetical protein BKA67DRAFT_534122 [Truncatella angustata]|uniref:Uncharacterized protein n=1 Tax=Truncatella angustata TaxID=152316 RepID=A0A9P8UMZ8_9PEZI|nr:uncharacterized protein BKA67DRAFT_534122 [Truncatella angustata]KAH6655188.1 hypothetical protein BKA67DRAFT_534122 [Truncatella angustata]KAH8204730.1 hypothetical protein TruAng_001064 [Truncatella angustata]